VGWLLPSWAIGRDVEFVPEVNAFVKLSDVARLYFDSQVTTAQPQGVTEAEFGAHVDITLTPILRRKLREADWERDRYLWARVGYEIFGSPDDQGKGPTEKRVMTELTGQAPLWSAWNIWLASRVRIDFRDIGGSFSKRYRYRLGIQQEIDIGSGRSLVPYLQGEILYDTRYNAWNRRIYQAGLEIKMAKDWRIEPYVSRQFDSRSTSSNVDQVGLQFKFYW
jgi:hypothetical protein